MFLYDVVGWWIHLQEIVSGENHWGQVKLIGFSDRFPFGTSVDVLIIWRVTELILRSKLFVPPLRPSLVERQRLLNKLENGRTGKLTLVSAPAGFGKTTLITSWIQQHNAVWLSLDSEDNDLGRFVTYVVAALQQIDSAFGEQIVTLLQANPQTQPEQMSTLFLNDLSYLDEAVLLVLDDFHLIENTQIHEMLAFWLEHLPPQLHFVITSRADLPFSISRWRVQQQVSEIRTADLRFTPEETAVFFNDLMGLDLTAADVAALDARTEGWIASLQLAALSLSQQDQSLQSQFIQQFSGSNRFVMDYLVDEILSRLSDDERAFLIETSIFARLCADLCDAVLETAVSQQMLDDLEQNNMFLIPLDAQHKWFRYHHLFADFLQHRHLQLPLGRRQQLHRRAADWFAAHQLLDEAIHHALAVDDFGKAANLMAGYSANLLVRGEIGKMLGWIDLLPTDVRQESAQLSIFYAWALIFTGQMEAAGQLVAELATVEDTPDWPMRAYVAVINGFLETRVGRFDEGIAITEYALVQLQNFAHKDDMHAIMVGATVINLADSYMWRGQFEQSYRQYQTAVTANRESGNILAGLGAVRTLADLTIAKGELRKTQDILQQGLQMAAFWEKTLPIPGTKLMAAAPIYASLGVLYCQWNDLALAKPLIEEAVELYRLGGAVNEAEGADALIHLRWAEGNLDAVDHLIEQLRLLGENNPHVYTQQRIDCAIIEWKCRLIQSGERWHYYGKDVAKWAQENGAIIADECNFINYFAHFCYARAILQSKNQESLLNLLQDIKHSAQEDGRFGDIYRTQVLQVLALAQSGNTAVALELLEKLLQQTEPEGYIRLFVDEGQPLAQLLRKLPATPYRDQLLNHFGEEKTGTKSPSPAQNLVEPLSERELEVLTLIANGATNQQIADELVIAKSTAKKHVSNIIGKLGVENRTAAIARARELHLI